MGFVPFTFVDLIDIILVAVIMYWIYRMTKGTNAPYILSGIIAVYLLWVVVRALNMELLSTILGQLISVGAIALIIVFQPELRRFLQMIGMRQKHFNFITRIFSTGEDTVQTNVVPIVTACREMSETKTGALIVIGQQSDLRLIAEGGIALDAKVSTSLIKNIFFKNAPLHRGRPDRGGQVHSPGDAERRAQVVRHAAPRGDRHERDFGRHHRRRLGGDGRHLDRTGRRNPPEHRPRAVAADPATLPDDQHAQTLEKGGRRISGAGARRRIQGRREVSGPAIPFRASATLPEHPKQASMLYPSRTARLALRAWREEDRPAFAAMNADERVMEYFPATLTAEESADLLDRIRDEFSTEGFGPYAVERLSDGELLGFTGLHRVTFSGGLEGQVEILWRLRHDAWGQGYATEAARACIAHAAKLGIPELVAFTFVGNGRSRRVMQKLGMTCVGEFDHPALPEGHPLRRHALYRIRTEQ